MHLVPEAEAVDRAVVMDRFDRFVKPIFIARRTQGATWRRK